MATDFATQFSFEYANTNNKEFASRLAFLPFSCVGQGSWGGGGTSSVILVQSRLRFVSRNKCSITIGGY